MNGIIKKILNNSMLSTFCAWDEGNSIGVILTGVGVTLHSPGLSSDMFWFEVSFIRHKMAT